MAAAAGDGVDDAHLAVGVGHERVDQRGLADAAVPDQHAGAAGERLAQRGRVLPALRDHPRHPERAVGDEQRLGVGEVGLGEAEQRRHAGVVGGHERAVDEPGAGLGVGERRDDDELVGVRDDHPLHRVVVVGGAAQRGGALADLDDPRQHALVAGGVAHHPHPVADHHALAAQRARLDGEHHDAVDKQREPAAVDSDHDTVDGVVVAGPLLGARAGVPPRALVVLDVALVVAPRHVRRVPTRSPRSRGRSCRWWPRSPPARRRRRRRGSRRRAPSGGRRRCARCRRAAPPVGS